MIQAHTWRSGSMSKVNNISSPRHLRMTSRCPLLLLPCILSKTSTTSINIQIRTPLRERRSARRELVHYRDANGTADAFGNFSDPVFSHLVPRNDVIQGCLAVAESVIRVYALGV